MTPTKKTRKTAVSAHDRDATKGSKSPPHTREMTIEGIMLHARAIIEQGRTQEFLAACKKAGFVSLTGPETLITFAREFIVAFPEAADASDPAASKKFSAIVQELMVSPIDC